jgi:hypothetical protein
VTATSLDGAARGWRVRGALAAQAAGATVLSVLAACGGGGGGGGVGLGDPGDDPAQFEGIPWLDVDPEDDRLLHTGAFAAGSVDVAQQGSVWHLRFLAPGGAEVLDYQIDAADAQVSRGVIEVYEESSDSWPIFGAGPCFRLSNGAVQTPAWLATWCTLDSQSSTADSVAFEYTDLAAGKLHRRRHTFQLVGKTLRVRVEALDGDLAYFDNYGGLKVPPAQGVEDPSLVQMTGALAAPIARFEDGSEQWFLASALDLARSNASHWELLDQDAVALGPDWIGIHPNTHNLYGPSSAQQLVASLDDTLLVTLSQSIADVLLTNDAGPSPYRGQMADRTAILFVADSTSWSQYQDHLAELASWGLDRVAAHTHAFWSASAPEGLQNMGPDWFPAVDEGGWQDLCAAAGAAGQLVGPYTLFAIMPESSPLYDAGALAYDWLGVATGAASDTKLFPTVVDEATLIEDAYGASLVYTDSQTWASPDNGGWGTALDQEFGSGKAATLAEAIAARKHWLAALRGTIQGPLLGESSNATQKSSCEWLWTGYLDGHQRAHNTGAGQAAYDLDAGDPRCPTAWPVIPEYELRVTHAVEAPYGNGLYSFFFSAHDGSDVFDLGTQSLILPLTEAALDRYRAYCVSFGRTAYFQDAGPFDGGSNLLTYAHMLREHYLVNELQRRTADALVQSIRYHVGGSLQSFEQVLAASESTDSFVDARLQITWSNGVVVHVNHGASAWSVSAAGTSFSLPEDGFVAAQPGTGFLAFSAVPAGAAGRCDYALAPGRYEFFDGRGVVAGYGGIATLNSRLWLENAPLGLTLFEDDSGAIVVANADPPAVASLSIEGAPATLELGAGAALRAVATHVDGSFQDVTTRVAWSSSDASVLTLDDCAVAWGLEEGQVSISCSAFGGVAPAPVSVLVDAGD